jgi:pimeloyl-ACP methyl ester carboxylesterase
MDHIPGRMRPGRAALLFLASLVAPTTGACGSAPASSSDPAGVTRDAGLVEAAPSGDAASPSPPVEAGMPAMTSTEGAPEAGSDGASDGGGPISADTVVVPCTNAVGDVYLAPANMPAMDMGLRGNIVACAFDSTLQISDIDADFTAKSVSGVTPTTPVDIYRIEYRTYREDGVPGLSSARVYLPHTPRSLPLPIIAVAHPTEGLAASCTPSQDSTSLEDEALPWAASGFAVVASDYAGLGTPGVQGYLDNHDQAHSMLDSVRALRTMLAPAVFDDRVLLVGYSQGGGAVLASQGLAKSYGAGGTIEGVVVFAAEYFMRMNSMQFVTAVSSPDELTIQTGVTLPVVVATRDYAWSYNVLGPDAGGVTFPSGSASGIESNLMSQCEIPFGGYIQGVAPHLGDLFDEGFRTSLLACMLGDSDAGGDDGGTCSGLAAQYYQWLQSDLVPPDPQGAPVLYVQGLSDGIMPPAQEAACNIGQLTAAGVSVQTCTDPGAGHTNVVARNVPFALQWSESILYGGAQPTCSAAGMPACTP